MEVLRSGITGITPATPLISTSDRAWPKRSQSTIICSEVIVQWGIGKTNYGRS
jgi:hypothetical protein